MTVPYSSPSPEERPDEHVFAQTAPTVLADHVTTPSIDDEKSAVPIPAVYQMRTLQHLSRTLADEEARFRQCAAWLSRLQDSCQHVATEAMGLFSILEEERVTALRLAEEIALVSSQTLAAWPEQQVESREALDPTELDVTNSSFLHDRDASITAQQQKTEAFHEMWETPTDAPAARRSRRRRQKAGLA